MPKYFLTIYRASNHLRSIETKNPFILSRAPFDSLEAAIRFVETQVIVPLRVQSDLTWQATIRDAAIKRLKLDNSPFVQNPSYFKMRVDGFDGIFIDDATVDEEVRIDRFHERNSDHPVITKIDAHDLMPEV